MFCVPPYLSLFSGNVEKISSISLYYHSSLRLHVLPSLSHPKNTPFPAISQYLLSLSTTPLPCECTSSYLSLSPRTPLSPRYPDVFHLFLVPVLVAIAYRFISVYREVNPLPLHVPRAFIISYLTTPPVSLCFSTPYKFLRSLLIMFLKGP